MKRCQPLVTLRAEGQRHAESKHSGHFGQDAEGVEGKAAGHRKHEDPKARGMQNRCIQASVAKMLGDFKLLGKLLTLEDMKTRTPEAWRIEVFRPFWPRC